MKFLPQNLKWTIYLVLTFGLFHFPAISQDWTTQYPFDSFHKYVDGYVDEDGKGWLVGKKGRVIRTIDNGQTWAPIPSFTDEDMKFVEIVPGTEGQQVLMASRERIFTSIDGGESWTESNSNVLSDNLMKIEIVNTSNMFLMDFEKNLLATTDGGDSWLVSLVHQSKNFIDVSFINENDGWTLSQDGDLFNTSNGGTTWDSVTHVDIAQQIKSLDFISSDVGFIGTNQNNFYKTEDGGLTWIDIFEDGFLTSISEIEFLSESEIYVIGNHSYIHKSIDGGKNWTRHSIANYAYFDSNRIKVLDNGTIWAVGKFQTLARSIDGGETWFDVFQAYKGDLNVIYFVDNQKGFVGGNNSQMLKTIDGGKTWTDNGNHGNFIKGIVRGKENKLFYSRGYAGVYMSEDEGDNWTQILTGVGFVREIVSTPSGNLHASTAVQSSNFIRSTDNGVTWEEQALPTDFDPNGMFFKNDLNGFAWDSPILYETTDGGDSWNLSTINANASVNDIFFVNDQNGWVMTNSQLLRTTDGGISWESLQKPAGAFSMVFSDENSGLACGGTGGVGFLYQTTDGGWTWELKRVSDYIFKGVTIVDASNNHFLAVGNGGLIEYTDNQNISSSHQKNFKDLILFPNPGNNQVTLDHEFNRGVLYIYNVQGQLIANEHLDNQNRPSVSTSSWLPGQYIFRFVGKKEQWVAPWVKL